MAVKFNGWLQAVNMRVPRLNHEVESAVRVPRQCRESAATVPRECHDSAARVPRGCRLGSRVVKGSDDVAYEVVAYEIAWPLLNKGVTRVPIRADLVTNHLSQRDASN